MKRIILTCIVLIGSMLTFSSLAAAKPDKPAKPDEAESAKSIAKEQCQALKKADKAAFKAVYGSNSIGKCVKAETRKSSGELKNAAKVCKAEEAADPVAFEQKYGNPDPYVDDNNAFGKCVSSKVGEKTTTDTGVFKNAAKACKAERASDREAFEDKYGTAKSKGRNALGKCVSTTVKATA